MTNGFQDENRSGRKGIYQEMWFFDVFDTKQDIAFFLNINVNIAELFKMKIKVADVVAQATINGEVFYNDGNDGYYRRFKCKKGSLRFVLGKGDIVAEGIVDDEIRVKGFEKKSGLGFDFVIRRLFDPWKPERLTIGAFKGDSIVYHPFIPLGKVDGVITNVRGSFVIDGYGYHDHDWGYLKSIQWHPWLIVKGENAVASIVKTPLDSLVHFQDDKNEHVGKVDSISFNDMITFKKNGSDMPVPRSFTVQSRCKNTVLKVETFFSSVKNMVNMGTGGKEVIAVHDNMGRSDVYLNEKMIYTGLSTSIYHWNLFEF